MRNRLKEIILSRCELINSTKKKREKKWKATYEIKKISSELDISVNTLISWYSNINQPKLGNPNLEKLLKYLKISIRDFFL